MYVPAASPRTVEAPKHSVVSFNVPVTDSPSCVMPMQSKKPTFSIPKLTESLQLKRQVTTTCTVVAHLKTAIRIPGMSLPMQMESPSSALVPLEQQMAVFKQLASPKHSAILQFPNPNRGNPIAYMKIPSVTKGSKATIAGGEDAWKRTTTMGT